MNEQVGAARIGQWYQRVDKGEMFVVTGIDDRSGTIELQTFDGDLDEIEANTWSTLPLEFAEAPEDETGPLDLDPEDLGYSETEMRPRDWNEPLPPATTKEHGTGLGLVISRAIVEAHSGRLDYHSNHPHGARLIVTLPLAADVNAIAHT